VTVKRDRRRSWILAVGVALMLAAMFSYLASLDDSDPDALPDSVEQVDGGAP
jgi:hypothetical protein